MRVVVDTNLWISYLIQPKSPIIDVLDSITEQHILLYSYPVLLELAEVLTRPKFAKYISKEDIKTFITEFTNIGVSVTITVAINDCRDPKDNKFLELAVSGEANCIVTGDKDLLALNPYQGIPIIKPTEFKTL